MVNAQEWLDGNYPNQIRSNVKELDISGKNKDYYEKLKGSLELKGFIKLEKLNCSFNKLNNLNLNDCVNLEVIDCSFNRLIDLDTSNCLKLAEINCYNNYLDNIQFPINSEKLELINLANNNFPRQNLSRFSSFTNLKKLSLGNWRRGKMERGIYNLFAGSLEPLKYLTKLRSLDIENTDIDSGLEFLPNSIEVFHCQTSERVESKVKVIEKELKNFVTKKQGKVIKSYNHLAWKRVNLDLVNKVQWIDELENELNNLHLALNGQNMPEKADQALQIFIHQQEEQVIGLRKHSVKEWQAKIEQPPK